MHSRYLDGLDSALHGAGLPYGYTLTIWASGHVLTDLRGSPSVWLAVLFAAGAATGYGALKWLSRDADPSSSSLAANPHLLRAGLTHVAAIAAALGAVILIAQVPSGVAWPAGGLAATALYLMGTAVELGRREREHRGG